MNQAVPFERWASEFTALASKFPPPQPRIIVVKEVDSTQDEARRRNASPGDIIIAWRQTNGRGRLGRTWADTGEDGVAMTMVLPRDRPERLAIASAVGVAAAIDAILKTHANGTHPGARVGIKWPNDVVINGRKIAGILIEQLDDRALIGIGINVNHQSWPPELSDRAISLAQLGVAIDRLAVMDMILQTMICTLRDYDDQLVRAFMERDVLVGETMQFLHNGSTIEGTVLRIDPMLGLAVRTSAGEIWLPAATTSIVPDSVKSFARSLH